MYKRFWYFLQNLDFEDLKIRYYIGFCSIILSFLILICIMSATTVWHKDIYISLDSEVVSILSSTSVKQTTYEVIAEKIRNAKPKENTKKGETLNDIVNKISNTRLKEKSDKAVTIEKKVTRVSEPVEARPVEQEPGDQSVGNKKPKYPIISKQLGENGRVVLLVKVSQSGVPVYVLIEESSGYERLDNSAYEAVSSWRFYPARNSSGENVESVIRIPVIYKLEEEAADVQS